MTGVRFFNKKFIASLSILVAFTFFLFVLTPSLYISAEIGADGLETVTNDSGSNGGADSSQPEPTEQQITEQQITETLPPASEGDQNTEPAPSEEPTGETDPLPTEDSQPSEPADETGPLPTEDTQPGEPTGETEPLPTEETQPEETSGDLDPQLFMASFLALEATVNYGNPSSSFLGFNGGATGGGGWTSGNLGKTYAEGEWVPYQLVLTGVQTAWGAGLDGMSQYDDQIMISYDFTNGGNRFIDMVRSVQVGEDPRNDLEAYPASDGTALNISTRDLLEDAQNDAASENEWDGFSLLRDVPSFDYELQINNTLPGVDDDPTDYTAAYRTIIITKQNLIDAGLGSADTIVIYFQLHLSRTFFWETDLHTLLADNDLTSSWGGYKYETADTNYPNGSGFVSGSSGHVQLETFGNKTVPLPVPESKPGSISGTKWLDQNGDGDRDAGDSGIANWTIIATVTFADLEFSLEAITDSDGNFSFPNVSYGTWTISEVSQLGYTQTSPNSGTTLPFGTTLLATSVPARPYDWQVVVDLDNESVTGIDFGNFYSMPSLSIEKSATPATYDAVGDVISYSYLVTNTGNVTLYGVYVVDDKATTSPASVASLAPGASTTFTASYSITQDDLDDGSVTNTAYATDGTTESDPDDETVTAVPMPALTIDKSATPATYDAVGDVISYSYLVTNTGNVTLYGVYVVDDKATTSPASVASLAPGASTTFTASYSITQDDLDDGSVTNTAYATDGETESEPDDETVTAVPLPALTIDKTATPATYNEVGDVISYSYLVTNTGNVTLYGVYVVDDKATTSPASVASLAPGASTTFTASYTITQDDLDDGSVTNTAYATDGETESDPDDETVTAVQNFALNITKTANPKTYDEVGDLISYTILVENTGNAVLTGLSVMDALLSDLAPSLDMGHNVGDFDLDGKLDVDETWTYTGTYTITQADLDSGRVDNTAYADSNETEPDSDDETVLAIPLPALTIVKTALPTTYDAVGDEIDYSYLVTNTGNVTLYDVYVVDDKATTSPASVASLAPGASTTFTATYTITQDDLDDGSVTNTAYATDGETESEPDDETVTAIPLPTLTIVKSALPATYDEVGDLINYSYLVTNTGNVTLYGVYVVDDKATTSPASVASLAPGASTTFTATYTITQADLDDGSVTNTAYATDGETESEPDDETVNAIPLPALTIVKSALPATYDAVGDVISYSYLVTNTGNVTLYDVYVVDDKATTSPASVASLAPGASTTFTASYTITQDDLDDGSVTNTAYATDGETESEPDDETVDAEQDFSLNITKTANPTTYDEVGDVIGYTILVENTGNAVLTGISVTDALLSDLAPTLDLSLHNVGDDDLDGKLDVDETWTYTGTYTITQADLNAGRVDNTAYADSNETEPDSDDETVLADQNPALTIVKIADESTVSDVGEIITYTITVDNTGNVDLTNVVLTDLFAGGAILTSGDTNTNDILETTETWVYTADYTVTQADLNAGTDLVNVASVDTDQTAPQQDDATTTIIQNPALTIVKDANLAAVSVAGQIILYTITVDNTGNIDLTDVELTDLFAGGAILTSGDLNDNDILETTETWVYTADYTVTAADIVAGTTLVNVAIVDTAQTAPEEDDAITDVLEVFGNEDPSVVLLKSADKLSASAGTPFLFTITIRNIGDTPFTITDFTDTHLSTLPDQMQELIGMKLEVGESVTRSYELTFEDAGTYTNTAFVEVRDIHNERAIDDDRETVNVIEVEGEIVVFGAEMPQTGDKDIDWLAMGALILIAAGCLLFLKEKRLSTINQ